MQNFFYDNKENLSSLETYWLFDPYKDIELKRENLDLKEETKS